MSSTAQTTQSRRKLIGQHTPGQWKTWNSGWANAPTIIYVGQNAPSLDRNNKLKMNGSTFIAEVSTQNMHLTGDDDVVLHHDDDLLAAAPDLLAALRKARGYVNDHADPYQDDNRASVVLAAIDAAISKATGI